VSSDQLQLRRRNRACRKDATPRSWLLDLEIFTQLAPPIATGILDTWFSGRWAPPQTTGTARCHLLTLAYAQALSGIGCLFALTIFTHYDARLNTPAAGLTLVVLRVRFMDRARDQFVREDVGVHPVCAALFH